MDHRQIERIVHSQYKITDKMVKPLKVCDHLVESGAITISMMQDIMAERTDSKKARAINVLMPKRDRDSYDKYYLALYETGNRHLADVLAPCVSTGVLRTEDSQGVESIVGGSMANPEQAPQIQQASQGLLQSDAWRKRRGDPIKVAGLLARLRVMWQWLEDTEEGTVMLPKATMYVAQHSHIREGLSSKSALDDHVSVLWDGQIRQPGTRSLYVEIKELAVSKDILSTTVRFLQIYMSYFLDITSSNLALSSEDHVSDRTLIDAILSRDNPKQLKPLQEKFRNDAMQLLSPYSDMCIIEPDSEDYFPALTLKDAKLPRVTYEQREQMLEEFNYASMKIELLYTGIISDSNLNGHSSVRSDDYKKKLQRVTNRLNEWKGVIASLKGMITYISEDHDITEIEIKSSLSLTVPVCIIAACRIISLCR